MVKRTCSHSTSLGRRVTHGTSARNPRQLVSSRHMMPGSQASPPSIISTRSPGTRSNVPWQISDTRCAMMLQPDPSVCHSM